MSGITVANAVNQGVTLTASNQTVTIASTGTVKATGVGLSAMYSGYGMPATISNAGILSANAGYGVKLLAGGSVSNSSATAQIIGALYGIHTGARGAATVSNLGTIASTSTTTGMGIFALGDGSSVLNGGISNNNALIGGYDSGVRIAGTNATVSNFGSIYATGLFGSAVYLRAGGSVTNGAVTDTTAILNGGEFGVEIQHAAGTVANYGTIQGTGMLGRGVVLQAGGSVTNGSNNDTTASIFATNRSGVYIGGTTSGAVSNYGTIMSIGPASVASNGVSIRPGGTVTNGSATDTTAAIIATKSGVYLQGLIPSAVVNFGTIRSLNAAGLDLYLGATVTNGTSTDTSAVIAGVTGVYDGGFSTITNLGTISGSGTAIVLSAGGNVINGGTADTVARITGGTGLTGGYGSTSVTNFGTIAGTAGSALVLTAGGQVTNGSASYTSAAITAVGVGIAGGAAAVTVNNYGTVSGGVAGIALNSGGYVGNGSTSNTTALISSGNTGVSSGALTASIMNFGTITGAAGAGVFLTNGGTVVNGSTTDATASISGAVYGVRDGLHGVGTVVNFGTIANTGGTSGMGVELRGNGSVTNGSTSAAITGFYEGVEIRGAAATVTNFGKITAQSTLGVGVYLTAGGTVINGSATDLTASIISAENGVEITHLRGLVNNFGTIKAAGPYARGIVLTAGGSVANGTLTDTAAYISASTNNAVYTGDLGPSYVTNFGTMKGNLNGVAMRGGGAVTNGAATVTKATISGSKHGVYIQALSASAVVNFGTISSTAKSSVAIYLGGSVVNGSNADTTARIAGPTGVYLGGSGTIANFGTILGTAGTSVSMRNGGAVVNGSAGEFVALISATGSSQAIYDTTGTTAITNFGTIKAASAAAVHLNTGGTVVNGSGTDTTASITGGGGGAAIEFANGAGTLINFGTITGGANGVAFTNGTLATTGTVINSGTIGNWTGTSAAAITFGAGSGRLVVNPGAVFFGNVTGGGTLSVLELAAGGTTVRTISGIGSSFSNFGTVVVDSGSSWSLSQTNTVTNFVNNGSVFVAPNGKLLVTGTVDPSSTGIFELNASSTLEIAANRGAGDQIQFLGTGTVVVDHLSSFGTNPTPANAATYTGPVINAFIAGDKLDLLDLPYSVLPATATIATYNAATGLLRLFSGTIAAGSLQFNNASLGKGSFHVANDGAGHTMLTHN